MMNKILFFLLFCVSFFPVSSFGQCDSTSIFGNDITHDLCTEVIGNVRLFYTNGIPPHPAGPWPSGGVIGAQDDAYYMCAFPQKAQTPTSIYDGTPINGPCSNVAHIGISLTGGYFSGYAARWFVDSSGMNNRDWLQEATTLGIDYNGSHVAGDRYHYHQPAHRYYQDSMGLDGSAHSPILGYAADGFPMYYRYVFDDPMNPASAIVDMASCYQLKTGTRPGDGIMAPDGPYDGTYFQDWEYLPGTSCKLDECNGRFGITPEFPNGTYYYVMTNGFPDLPRCFYGEHPDVSFRSGQICPPSTAGVDCSFASNIQRLNSKAPEFTVYPNPASDQLIITPKNAKDFLPEMTSMSVFSNLGALISTYPKAKNAIDVSGFSSGTYYLELNTPQGIVLKKFIVEN